MRRRALKGLGGQEVAIFRQTAKISDRKDAGAQTFNFATKFPKMGDFHFSSHKFCLFARKLSGKNTFFRQEKI